MNKGIFIYFLSIFATIWAVLFPKTKLAWKLFKDLPEPPNELKENFITPIRLIFIQKMRIYNLLKDFLLPKEVLYLQDDDSFNLALRDLEANNILAIDTEFIWRNTYFPKLSLIQISTYKKIYIIDCITLNISELENLYK